MVAFFFCHNKSRAESDSPCAMCKRKKARRLVSLRSDSKPRSIALTRPSSGAVVDATDYDRPRTRAREAISLLSVNHHVTRTGCDTPEGERGARARHPRDSRRVKKTLSHPSRDVESRVERVRRRRRTPCKRANHNNNNRIIDLPSCGRSPRAPWSCTIRCTRRSHPSARRSTAPTPCRTR